MAAEKKQQSPPAIYQKNSFTERTIDVLASLMDEIENVANVKVEYEIRDGDRGEEMVVTGLTDEPVVFTQHKSARAGLEMWLNGYLKAKGWDRE